MSEKPKIGAIAWHDLTVENAEQVKDFYSEIIGWKAAPVDMGGYDDFSMITPSEECFAGICHARGKNADLPPQWLVYITVEDLDRSIVRCEQLGGKVVAGPKNMGDIGRYAVIQDPAGAVCALWQEIE
jgi:predicted enzyme related to lactoylglutathione lyase